MANKLANVTSLDSKSKKQTPKDEVSISVSHAIDLKTVETKTNPNDKQIETESESQKEPGPKSEQPTLALDCTTPVASLNDDHIVNSPIEIIDVSETNDPLGLTKQTLSSAKVTKETLDQESTSLDTSKTEADLVENGLSELVSEVSINDTVNSTTSSVFVAQNVGDRKYIFLLYYLWRTVFLGASICVFGCLPRKFIPQNATFYQKLIKTPRKI